MGIYIIGGVPMRIGSHSQYSPTSASKPKRKRDINMSWILQKKVIYAMTETITTYEVGYMEEVELPNYSHVYKFQFLPIYKFKTIEEAEKKVHYLNGGNE